MTEPAQNKGTSTTWSLYREAKEQWWKAEDKLQRIGEVLSRNGCDCMCDCGSDGHEDDCERCLACEIGGCL